VVDPEPELQDSLMKMRSLSVSPMNILDHLDYIGEVHVRANKQRRVPSLPMRYWLISKEEYILAYHCVHKVIAVESSHFLFLDFPLRDIFHAAKVSIIFSTSNFAPRLTDIVPKRYRNFHLPAATSSLSFS
jgi:hypothetical protein